MLKANSTFGRGQGFTQDAWTRPSDPCNGIGSKNLQSFASHYGRSFGQEIVELNVHFSSKAEQCALKDRKQKQLAIPCPIGGTPAVMVATAMPVPKAKLGERRKRPHSAIGPQRIPGARIKRSDSMLRMALVHLICSAVAHQFSLSNLKI
jgi:hypothetical protein